MSVEATTPKHEMAKAVNEFLSALEKIRTQVKDDIDIDDKDFTIIINTMKNDFEKTICQLVAKREILYSESKMTDRPFIL